MKSISKTVNRTDDQFEELMRKAKIMLRFVRRQQKKYKPPVTHAMLAEHTGLAPASINYNILAFVDEGWIEEKTQKSAGIEITKRGEYFLTPSLRNK